MKKLTIICAILILMQSCSRVLDIKDLNSYPPEQVWNDAGVANAYVLNLYSVFGNWNAGADRMDDQLAGILFPPDAITVTNGAYADWNYTNIRLINQGLIDLEKGSLAEADKKNFRGQMLFLRAYSYFNKVVAHGGVPYIKIPQQYGKDTLDVARNSTKECFDWMVEDLDEAIQLLPGRIPTSSADWGRIDRSFALAFKAKMLLYKASPQFNPTNPWNNDYWQQAYTANKAAMDSLTAAGFRLIGDYSKIALNEKNEEIVFPVINKFPGKTASWETAVRPGTVNRGNASACPTWEMVKAFPMADGKLFNDPSGAYYTSEAQLLQSYWKNRDPRFGQSILWNARPYPVGGKPSGYRQYTGVGVADALDNFGVNPSATDRSSNNDRYTGFFILKNSDLRLTQAQVDAQYDIDYVLMRFAEVMLNYAEAANETGHTSDAIEILKAIRKRAQIEPGANNNYGITASDRESVRTAIMNERNIELCFEGFRFWDLRRWRMFSVLNTDGTKHGVESIAIQANGSDMPITQARQLGDKNQLTEDQFRYTLIQVPQAGVKKNELPDKYYFFPIPLNVMSKSKKLQQNLGWTNGSFDPTLH